MVDLFDDRGRSRSSCRAVSSKGNRNLRGPLITQQQQARLDAQGARDRRALLARLVNDLQWRYTVNEGEERANSKAITKTTGVIFMVAIALFAAMVVAFAILRPRSCRRSSIWAKDSDSAVDCRAAGGWGAAFVACCRASRDGSNRPI